MWNESKQGEESYSFALSPSVAVSLLNTSKGGTNSHQPSIIANNLQTLWASSVLANSSGHQLREFQDVYVMCVYADALPGNTPGPNCSWLVASPSDCQTWDLEIDTPQEAPMTKMSNLNIGVVEVDTAITIARRRGGAIYHAPIDIISSLVHVNSSLVWNDSVYLHVHTQTAYVKEWLSIVGINSDRLISGGFRAKWLYVPELRTENPSRVQLTWLQQMVWKGIGFPDLAKRNLLIVSKRGHRGISNHGGVMQLAKEYAATHGLEVYIHGAKKLPPVKEQLELFSRAVMVLAPHGAGELNIIASLPGACIVEMFPWYYHDKSLVRLITLLGHHYTGIELLQPPNTNRSDPIYWQAWSDDAPNSPVNLTELRLAMEQCGDRAGVL
jgi:hypothetical protein